MSDLTPMTLSVGELSPIPTEPGRNGMQVAFWPGIGLCFFVWLNSKAMPGFVHAVHGGRIEIGMMDAPPFGFFHLNAGPHGDLDAPWALGMEPDEIREETVEYLKTFADPAFLSETQVPWTTIACIDNRTNRVVAMRSCTLYAKQWHEMARILLSHRTTGIKWDYWRERWEAKLRNKNDFVKHGYVFVQNYPGVTASPA